MSFDAEHVTATRNGDIMHLATNASSGATARAYEARKGRARTKCLIRRAAALAYARRVCLRDSTTISLPLTCYPQLPATDGI